MTVLTKEHAFAEANKIMKHDYEYDAHRSSRAGYPIYFSTAYGVSEWISDLGNRLEVNLENGESINIWIDDRQPLERSGFKKNAIGIWVAA